MQELPELVTRWLRGHFLTAYNLMKVWYTANDVAEHFSNVL